MMVFDAQNAQMAQQNATLANQTVQMNTISAQNNELNRKIEKLETTAKRIPPTDTESLLKYVHNEMTSIQSSIQPCASGQFGYLSTLSR
ncbi:hypothetical protein HK096_008417 [Nowakowskiella sp. JEL0078]|nr:hypothetical protein HK096_008417 [Nowakowskiella sp. JEL0078]